MTYSAQYTDEHGRIKTVTFTEEDCRAALKNDYDELVRRYNPKYVTFERIRPEPGEMLHLKVTVHAPSHYLSGPNDTKPKPCDSMSVHIICQHGYPVERIIAYYESNYYLASPNVFVSGAACISDWIPLTSSLLTVVEKLVRDMIHDTSVNIYEPPANRNKDVVTWHKNQDKAGNFPTIRPALLFTAESHSLPPRRTNSSTTGNTPVRSTGGGNPLPPRRR